MSRAIKFRAWVETRAFNGEPKGFEYLDLYVDNENDFANFPPENIEQYTGLKDNNGKEIYEGDIIESTWNGDKAEVVWNDVEGEWEHYADFNKHSKYSGSVVIGNIHENPELLKGVK